MNVHRPVVPVILSGGAGTRLWPTSRALYPKQLLPLLSELSLLQETAWRARGPGFIAPIVVCSEEHRFIIVEQLRALGIEPLAVILEPVGRNTAPAIVAAAQLVLDRELDASLLVLPSDHLIENVEAFRRAVDTAARVAQTDRLVTFGICPDRIETGYGHIRQGSPLRGSQGAFSIERFVEKPDWATAQAMKGEAGWLWNSGMFVLPPKLLLEEIGRFEPEMLTAVTASVLEAHADLGFLRLEEQSFASAPAKSIDYAVMERTDKAVVVPAHLGWSDVGSWSSLWEREERDSSGNVTVGEVVALDSCGSYLRGEGVLVATLGVADAVVVATPDAVLVADRRRAQDVGKLVELMRKQTRPEATSHKIVYRPWGCYESVDSGPGFQVKHITVKPGHRLSLQKHAYRAEHWVVISGRAAVTRGEEELVLEENMSIDIPVGCVHRLGNSGGEDLHLIEVQTGSYLGEDDIVRLEDAYGRSQVDAPH